MRESNSDTDGRIERTPFSYDEGTYLVDGEEVHFFLPREALDRGTAAAYQTLALVPLLPVWRNFFLGSELRKG